MERISQIARTHSVDLQTVRSWIKAATFLAGLVHRIDGHVFVDARGFDALVEEGGLDSSYSVRRRRKAAELTEVALASVEQVVDLLDGGI